MTGLGYRDCCREKFVDLRILTLPCLYILTCLLHIRDNLYKYTKPLDNHQYNTRNKDILLTKYTRIQRARDGINYHGVKFFNALPVAIQTLGVAQFKKIIKDFLVSNAFYSYEEFIAANFDAVKFSMGSVLSGAAGGS